MTEPHSKTRTHREDKELRLGILILLFLALLLVAFILLGIIR
jgi:hypothetical protein